MRKTFVVTSILLGVIVCLGIGEAAIRFLNPPPPVQFIRNLGDLWLTELNGAPVWQENSDNPIRVRPCALNEEEGALKVAVFGSSIFYGSGVAPKANFSLALEQKLTQTYGKSVCVVNYAQPGFAHQNKIAVAKDEIPKFKPDLVLWEIWLNDSGKYIFLDGTAYNVSKLILNEDGYPALLGLSGSLNKWLLSNSKLYEFAAFTLNANPNMEKDSVIWERLANSAFKEIIQLVEENNAELMFAFCPPLHTPFRVQRERPQREYVPVAKLLDRAQKPYVYVMNLFGKQSIYDVRVDDCCHYNEQGHRTLAEAFSKLIPQTFPSLKN